MRNGKTLCLPTIQPSRGLDRYNDNEGYEPASSSQSSASAHRVTPAEYVTRSATLFRSAIATQLHSSLTESDDEYYDKTLDGAFEPASSFDGQRVVELGSYRLNVVGIRYYDGMTFMGEHVTLMRESNNRYDRNAIRVGAYAGFPLHPNILDNLKGEHVGHIDKEIAKHLAPMLDTGKIFLEAVVIGDKTVYDLPIQVGFYCDWLRCADTIGELGERASIIFPLNH
ncbi:Helicase-like transcription factor [Neolecta irregularis DAH-3]|uniref:Helicase-like transcription factor n=1 Tax=Neolecta irregularis (strain DAH-3) TaxID=1198029 RepID=A0A1U7LJS8_NEOID|nr:Helicase-like transcription factor [Neolecta irregularis DAH-3]|eukprot:OLL22888.1 Helicase-like transcription factor [Neolecta irregularis DAH-3]